MNDLLESSRLTLEREKLYHFQQAVDSLPAKGLSTTLAPYQPGSQMPWNKRRVAHLIKRTGFGAHAGKINELLQLSPSQAVDQIIQDAINAPMPPVPIWIDDTPPTGSALGQYITQNQIRSREYKIAWTDEMRKAPFRERLAFFWRNHFVISSNNDIFAPLWHRYLDVIRTHTFGNFKDFCKAIGLDHGMLIYLDGRNNRSSNDKPQENYAREFLELFTMGIKDKNGAYNYTQQDITELAKCFSGYSVDLRPEFSVDFSPSGFYDEDKTILGRTGNFGYEEAIDIIFEERAEKIAYFICKKIYRYFVYQGVNDSVVQQMATIFLNNNFEILPVITALLKSEHFFDAEFIGAKIKSPIEFLNGLYVETGVEPNNDLKDDQSRWLDNLGQDPMDAPNVAGWPGYHLWLGNTTITQRWEISEYTLNYNGSGYAVDVVALAQQLDINDPGDPVELAMALTEYFIQVPIPEAELAEFPSTLRQGISPEEWSLSHPDADRYIKEFIVFLRKLPEYNLF